MNKKIKIAVLSIVSLLGLFASANMVSAQYSIPTCNSATLYGTVTPNGSPTQAWFDWGPSPSYGNSTSKQTFTTTTTYSAVISGLSENTKYYYRAMAQNPYGTATGQAHDFTTSTCTTQAPTVNLTADNNNLDYGGSTNIRWSSTNAAYCRGSNFNTGDQTSGSVSTGALTNSKTYNITCYNSSGQSVTDSVTVNVGYQAQNPTVTLTADDQNISYGGSTYLRWNSSNATSCSGSNFNTGNQTSGSVSTGSLTNTTTYHITCTGSNGQSVSASTTVNVGGGQQNPTVSLTANVPNLNYGDSTYISWTSTNTSSCSGTGFNTNNRTSGTYNTNPLYATTTYSISCTGFNGQQATASVTINVSGQQGQNPTVNLSADNQSLNNGGSTYIRWNSTNANYCTGSNFNANNQTSGSYYTGALNNTTTYSITCTGNNGQSANASVTVNVGNQQGGSPTVNLTADVQTMNYGLSTYLRWTSTNANYCTGSNFNTGNQTSGSYYTGALNNTTTYSITCYGNNGLSANSSVTVNITGGQQGQVSVSTTNATNIGYNYATLNGYITNNNSNANAWFEWGTNPSYYSYQTTQTNYGSNTSYSYYLSGLNPNTTYYFRAAANNNFGQTVYGNQLSFTTNNTGGGSGNQPIVTTYSASAITNNSATLNGYIDPNNSSYVTRWFEWGSNYNNLYTSTNRQSGYSGNFSEMINGLTPNTTYYFRAAAQGNYGSTVYGNTLSFVTSSYNYNNNCGTYSGSNCAPTAVTTTASNIGAKSARLNGLALFNSNVNVNTSGYFEYGTTQSLGSTTQSKEIGSSALNPFYSSLFNLASNTTYYFRAVASNQYGVSRGDIMSFNTGSPVVYEGEKTRVIYKNPEIVTNVNDGISRPSLVFLTVSRDGEIINKGSTIEYVVNYKNVSSKHLKNIVLQTVFPRDLQFLEASRGSFSTDSNTLVANIGGLNPQEEGSVRATVKVSNTSNSSKVIVVTANMAYTIAENNLQEQVFAYSKNTIEQGTAASQEVQQGALAFLFGTGFLPTSLLGWLLILLFIVLLILAIRKAYYNGGGRIIAPPHYSEEENHNHNH